MPDRRGYMCNSVRPIFKSEARFTNPPKAR
jgi:hypothetical protein